MTLFCNEWLMLSLPCARGGGCRRQTEGLALSVLPRNFLLCLQREAKKCAPVEVAFAQINGRDELEIPVKAKFDGEYVAALNGGFFKGLSMDMKCFFGTIVSVLKSDGVVEGGTGELKKKEEQKKG